MNANAIFYCGVLIILVGVLGVDRYRPEEFETDNNGCRLGELTPKENFYRVIFWIGILLAAVSSIFVETS